MVWTIPLSFDPIDMFSSILCFKKMASMDFVNMLSPRLPVHSIVHQVVREEEEGMTWLAGFFGFIPAGFPELFLQVEDCTVILLLFYFISPLRIFIECLLIIFTQQLPNPPTFPTHLILCPLFFLFHLTKYHLLCLFNLPPH